MALHNLLGQEGERLAAAFLEANGFSVIASNWRHRHYEIDIVAIKENVLHCVEVKTRHSTRFGYPEDGVSRKKFSNLKIAAEQFMHQYRIDRRLQFDILAISLQAGQEAAYFFIEDVYL